MPKIIKFLVDPEDDMITVLIRNGAKKVEYTKEQLYCLAIGRHGDKISYDWSAGVDFLFYTSYETGTGKDAIYVMPYFKEAMIKILGQSGLKFTETVENDKDLEKVILDTLVKARYFNDDNCNIVNAEKLS